MGAVGCRGAFGVTLQFARARSARGCWETQRELNLARRRTRTPWLLNKVERARGAQRLHARLAKRLLWRSVRSVRAASHCAGNCRDRTPSSTDNGFAKWSLRCTPPSMGRTVSRIQNN